MIAPLWRRVISGLDLDRLGVRRTWTVRLAHGVYVVQVRQSPLGDRVLVDGREVGRTDPWAYDAVVPFKLDRTPAAVHYVSDTRAGTLRTDLYVDGERIAPDVRGSTPARRTRWGMVAERAAYVLGGALIAGGLAGGPVADAVRQSIWTLVLLVMFSGLRAIDPFGVLTVTFDKMLEDQPSMAIAGLEIVAIALIAADRYGLRRRIPFVRERRLLPRVLGWTLIALVAFVLLAIG